MSSIFPSYCYIKVYLFPQNFIVFYCVSVCSIVILVKIHLKIMNVIILFVQNTYENGRGANKTCLPSNVLDLLIDTNV